MDKTLQQQKDELMLHYQRFIETFKDPKSLPKSTMKRIQQAYKEKMLVIDMKMLEPVEVKVPKQAYVET